MRNPPDVEAFLARQRAAQPEPNAAAMPERRATPVRDRATAALDRMIGRQIADDTRETQAHAREPFATLDRTGFLDRGDLGRAERRAFLRLPSRRSWPDLDELDEQIAGFEQRSTTISTQLLEAREQHKRAPGSHARDLARWELAGRAGDRPVSQAKRLEDEIADLEAARDGLEVAVDELLEAKAQFVEKHRARLTKDADAAVDVDHARMARLIDELQAARVQLAENRSAALWTRLYPTAAAGQDASTTHIVGGLSKPTRDLLAVNVQIDAGRLLDLLRRDADWLRAAASPQQRAAIAGHDPNRPDPAGAVWDATPEGHAADRAEKQAALRRYRQEWGTDPR